MRLRNSMFIAVALLCTGCATYLNPLVGTLPMPAPAGDDGKVMPQLGAALNEVHGKIKQLEQKRDDTMHSGRLLDLMMFGFGAGAAGYALRPNHSTAVTNLTFAAGASYAGSSLFAPGDVAGVYNAGVTAMACVVGKGAALRSAAIRYVGQVKADEGRGLPQALVTPANCNLTPELRTNFGAAMSAQDRVQRLLGYVLASDSEEATRTVQAANGIVAAVNREVLKRSATHDAIFAAAKGLLPRTTGIVVQSDKKAPAQPARTLVICDTDVGAKLQDFTRNYKEIESGLTTAVNAMGSLDTSCMLDPGATEALVLSQEDVTVTKDATFNVLISGGRPPYAITPQGASSKDIDVQLIAPSTIVIIGRSTIAGAGGPFLFQVKDNSVVSSPKTLTVHTK